MTTTGRAPIEFPREPAAGAVVRAVDAARRRLRLVSTIRLIAIAAPTGVALGAAPALAGWTSAWAPVALGVLGASAATVWAAAHTPPPATVARILDAHLELKDRVSAALQLQADGDAIAALVARDAAARLARVNLTALFPVTIDLAPVVAIAVAVAMAAWLASSSTGGGRSEPRADSAAGSASEGSDSNPGGRSAAPAPGSASRQPSTRQGPSVPARDARPGDSAQAASREASAASSPRTSPNTQVPVGDTAPGRAAGTAARNAQTGSTQAAAAGGARGGLGGAAAAGRSADGALSTGAGGATSGSALASAGSTTAQPSAASYATARANAEAALARDVIPPDYREHVRAYFRALASSGTAAGGDR